MAQDGSLYVVGDTCYLKYYIIVDGTRKHTAVKLCKRSDVHDWWKKKGKKGGFSSAVRELQRETMDKVKTYTNAAGASALPLTKKGTPGEMLVIVFWEHHKLR